MIYTIIQIIFFAACLFVFYLALRPIVNGAVFFPTNQKDLEIMLSLADAKKGEKMADLGSGDGRVVMAFAKKGVEAHGYEINPILVWYSRRFIKKQGLEGKAFIHWKSFWKENFSGFDIITVYAFPHIIIGLEKKIRRELKKEARIISNSFAFPKWTCQKKEKDIFCYLISKK